MGNNDQNYKAANRFEPKKLRAASADCGVRNLETNPLGHKSRFVRTRRRRLQSVL